MWSHTATTRGAFLFFCLCCSTWLAQGQAGFDSLSDALPVASSASPRLEHRGHVSHFFRNVSAPAPGPAAGAPSQAPLLSRAVAGVAHVGAPAAEGPQPPLQLPGSAGTFSQLPKAQASPPMQAFGLAPEAADNDTSVKAKQVFTPATPAAFVADDGTLVLMGPSTPSAAFTGTGASANHLLWWIVTIIALVAIMCSIAWAYSRNRSRRYMDLKEADNRMTEMAAQQRRDAHV
ncbi:g8501 [Coccomyxa viridis]|uniref:G8501 protein n=1 Tax=Coccomyxa viridis TaxID=1274662 RepID=A0ABP1G4M4_9CHLO